MRYLIHAESPKVDTVFDVTTAATASQIASQIRNDLDASVTVLDPETGKVLAVHHAT